MLEEVDPGGGVVGLDHDIFAEDLELTLLVLGHLPLEVLQAVLLLRLFFGLLHKALVHADEGLLLLEDALGLNGELGGADGLDLLTEEGAHQATPFRLVVEVFLVHPLIGLRVVVTVVANGTLADFAVNGDQVALVVRVINDLKPVDGDLIGVDVVAADLSALNINVVQQDGSFIGSKDIIVVGVLLGLNMHHLGHFDDFDDFGDLHHGVHGRRSNRSGDRLAVLPTLIRIRRVAPDGVGII